MKRLGWIAAFGVLGVLVFASWRVASRPPLIDVTTARTEDVTRVLAVTGRVKARLTNDVLPLVSGTVTALLKAEGDAVRRGDLLARLDAQVTEATIAQANAQLASRQVELSQRRREFDRLRALNAAGGIADRDVDQARSSLDGAETSVRQIQALLAETQGRLRDYTLRSPIDGFVLSRNVDPGQNVTPQTVLFELATGSDAEVEAEIDEQYVGELRVGLPAVVSPLTGERRTFSARVAFIGRRVSDVSGAVPVRLAFEGKAPRLPVGLSVDVNLEIARHPKSVTVPRAAVAGLGERPYVLLVHHGTTDRRDVDVIDWPSARIVVIKGVVPGDTVAVTPRAVPVGILVRTQVARDAI